MTMPYAPWPSALMGAYLRPQLNTVPDILKDPSRSVAYVKQGQDGRNHKNNAGNGDQKFKLWQLAEVKYRQGYHHQRRHLPEHTSHSVTPFMNSRGNHTTAQATVNPELTPRRREGNNAGSTTTGRSHR
jgi:hypothetical protein